jgi:cytochrome c oxidase subunit 2
MERSACLGRRNSMSVYSSQVTTALAPNSPQAHSMSLLIMGVVIMACAVALLVSGLVAYALIRFRDRGQGAPRQGEGNRLVEIVYTVVPLGMMVTLFVFTVFTMRRAEPPIKSPPQLVIIAHQWWWELRYPGAGVVSANEIHIPAGVPFRTELRSADVIHEFWMPQLGPKMDAVPGQVNRLMLQGDRPGVCLGACAEFCGAQHAWMRLRVIIEPPARFASWERAQKAVPAPPPAGTLAGRGRAQFLSQSCSQCHALGGTVAGGDTGPDLTHLASRATLASGALDNTPSNLRRWLSDPQEIKPGCHMPNMKLSPAQIDQIVAYLETLK